MQSPDYDNKLDIRGFNTADTYYLVEADGFLWINAGVLAPNNELVVYDISVDQNLLFGFRSNAIFYATSLLNECSCSIIPVSVGMKLYVVNGYSGYVWFVPYKIKKSTVSTNVQDIEYGSFALTNSSVSLLGTQSILRFGTMVNLHIRVRLTEKLSNVQLGVLNFKPISDIHNLWFYNQLSSEDTFAVCIDKNGCITLETSASVGYYMLDASYICKSY